MTGGVVVDDVAAIDRLLYSSASTGERWVRFRIAFADGGGVALHDPRRFGRVILDPDEEVLGPDALAVTEGELARALASPRPGGGPALKARLLDQHKLAGIGNLLADEILWRADLSPQRPSASLTPAELRRLHRQLRRTLKQLLVRGGSHLGDLMEHRRVGGGCPRDGAELGAARSEDARRGGAPSTSGESSRGSPTGARLRAERQPLVVFGSRHRRLDSCPCRCRLVHRVPPCSGRPAPMGRAPEAGAGGPRGPVQPASSSSRTLAACPSARTLYQARWILPRVDEERGPDGPGRLLAVHGLLAPGSVLFHHLVARVREQREASPYFS